MSIQEKERCSYEEKISCSNLRNYDGNSICYRMRGSDNRDNNEYSGKLKGQKIQRQRVQKAQTTVTAAQMRIKKILMRKM